MLKQKLPGWNNYDWLKYKAAVAALAEPNGKPTPQAQGRTRRENWQLEWRDNLDEYVERIKRECEQARNR